MSSVEQALQALQQAITAVDTALSAGGSTASGPRARPQLLRLRTNRAAMLADVNARAAGNPAHPVTGHGHIIADSWPFDSVLGAKALTAEHAYTQLRSTIPPRGLLA
jgi:hypothetical protein